MTITFSTSWYILKAKFDTTTYENWINNMLSNVNQYNLIVYTDELGSRFIEKYLDNPRIKMIIKPPEEFYTYRYKDSWIKNHEKNTLLKDRIDWKLNMLWAEKIHFVYETMRTNPFGSEWFGWCDIGYFRGNPVDINQDAMRQWPNANKIENLSKSHVYYALVNNYDDYLSKLITLISMKNSVGLPEYEIPANQVSVAGGFFISHQSKLDWWRTLFDQKLALYFENERLVKDDQIIIADCVFSNMNDFILLRENNPNFDNWFMFQRFLL
jgi:hypothetical protein